jgi:hypothetical protein
MDARLQAMDLQHHPVALVVGLLIGTAAIVVIAWSNGRLLGELVALEMPVARLWR